MGIIGGRAGVGGMNRDHRGWVSTRATPSGKFWKDRVGKPVQIVDLRLQRLAIGLHRIEIAEHHGQVGHAHVAIAQDAVPIGIAHGRREHDILAARLGMIGAQGAILIVVLAVYWGALLIALLGSQGIQKMAKWGGILGVPHVRWHGNERRPHQGS